MNFGHACFLFLVFACFGFCQSPIKNSRKAFDEVDASLETSNKTQDGSLNRLYGQIETVLQKDTPERLLADRIYLLTNDAVGFIDSLKIVLSTKDQSGDRTDVAAALLVNTPSAKRLLHQLISVQSITRPVQKDSPVNSYTDDLTDDIDAPSNISWDESYFKETPTAAALVMLTKFQNDCFTAAIGAIEIIFRTTTSN